MNRRLLLIVFLSTLILTLLATGHQLTNAAPDMAPPPQHAPAIGSTPTPSWQIITGGGQDDDLSDVSMVSANDGWAVGAITWPSSYGTLTHYDGQSWGQIEGPIGTWLNAVKMISATEGWAAGYVECAGLCNHAVLMHYSGNQWSRVVITDPVGIFWMLRGIDVKDNTGWVVSDEPYFLQFNGINWATVAVPVQGMESVSVIDSAQAWAVGENDKLAHYLNGIWSLVTPTLTITPSYYDIYLNSVHMLNANEGWAAGYSRYLNNPARCLILHYDGVAWLEVACPASSAWLTSVNARSANDVWTIGGLGQQLPPVDNGVAYHYNGSTWVTATLAPGTPPLNSVKLVGANDGWAVGTNGTILRLMNGTWTRVRGSSLYVGPIDSLNGDEVWYGGPTGQFYRWQSGTFSQYTSPLTMSLSALDMVSSTLGWGGTLRRPYRIARYSNGTWDTWPVSSSVLDIAMVGPDEGWIGTTTNIYHYTSAAGLVAGTTPSGGGVRSLSMLDTNHGWAYDYYGGVFTYTNGSWAEVTPSLTTTNASLKVIGISPNEAWLAGYSRDITQEGIPAVPELHHFAGGTWTSVPMPDWFAFLNINKVSATEWWATGRLQTLEYAFLHYKDGVFTTAPAAGEDVQEASMLPDGTGFASGVGSLLWLHSYSNSVYLPIVMR